MVSASNENKEQECSANDKECAAIDDSFVEVGGTSIDDDFVIKMEIDPNKFHRLRFKDIVDPSTGKLIDLVRLSDDFLNSRTSTTTDAATGTVEFSYLDVDGDLCVISTPKDLSDAIQQFKDKGHLKLMTSFVVSNNPNPHPTTSGVQEPNDNDKKEETSESTYKERVLRAMKGPPQSTTNNEETQQQQENNLDHLEDIHPEIIRSHLVDGFRDHFNLDSCGKKKEQKFYRGDDLGDAWSVMMKYQLHHNVPPVGKSTFIALDDIYLDLTLGPSPDDEPIVRVAIPSVILTEIADQISGIDSPYYPPATALDPVFCYFDPTSTEFYRMKITPEGNTTTTNEGLLVDALEQQQFRHFYKASGIFTIAAMKDPISLDIVLVEVIAFQEADEVLQDLYSRSPDGAVDSDFDHDVDFNQDAEAERLVRGWTMNYSNWEQ